jgi:hypothetical protein
MQSLEQRLVARIVVIDMLSLMRASCADVIHIQMIAPIDSQMSYP